MHTNILIPLLRSDLRGPPLLPLSPPSAESAVHTATAVIINIVIVIHPSAIATHSTSHTSPRLCQFCLWSAFITPSFDLVPLVLPPPHLLSIIPFFVIALCPHQSSSSTQTPCFPGGSSRFPCPCSALGLHTLTVSVPFLFQISASCSV